MKLDELVKKRFEELEKKALTIRDQNSNIGTYVDPEKAQEWSSSVLSLLQRAFGESSTHFQSFHTKYQAFKWTKYQDFAELKGIFKSAKEDYEAGNLFTVRGLIPILWLSDANRKASISTRTARAVK